MCLETIIGLSRSTCNCFEDTPDGYDESDSGLYLDELEGITLKMVEGASDCEQGGLWDLMTKARDNALKDLRADFLVQVGANYKKTIENFTYQIGSVKPQGTYNPGTFYAGVRLAPRQIRNGLMTLNHVKLLFNTSILVQCSLFNNLSDTPLETFSVNCVANVATQSAALNYELPMYEAGENVEYYLVYELPVTARPLATKISCSTCNKWPLDCCDDPCFGNRMVKDQMWNNNLMVGLIKGDTWDELDGQTGFGNQTGGIILNITMNCNYDDILCSNLDFGNGGIPDVLARAAQYRAGALLIAYMQASPNINRYTLMGGEQAVAKRAEYLREYSTRISWLSQHVDVTYNGCYYCEPRMIKAGIMA
jgi:hypothetical protein